MNTPETLSQEHDVFRSFRLPRALDAVMTEQASRTGQSVSAYIRQVLAEHSARVAR